MQYYLTHLNVGAQKNIVFGPAQKYKQHMQHFKLSLINNNNGEQ